MVMMMMMMDDDDDNGGDYDVDIYGTDSDDDADDYWLCMMI